MVIKEFVAYPQMVLLDLQTYIFTTLDHHALFLMGNYLQNAFVVATERCNRLAGQVSSALRGNGGVQGELRRVIRGEKATGASLQEDGQARSEW